MDVRNDLGDQRRILFDYILVVRAKIIPQITMVCRLIKHYGQVSGPYVLFKGKGSRDEIALHCRNPRRAPSEAPRYNGRDQANEKSHLPAERHNYGHSGTYEYRGRR